MFEEFSAVRSGQRIRAMACVAATIGAMLPSSAVSLTISRIQNSASAVTQATLLVPCIQSRRLFKPNLVQDLQQVSFALCLGRTIRGIARCIAVSFVFYCQLCFSFLFLFKPSHEKYIMLCWTSLSFWVKWLTGASSQRELHLFAFVASTASATICTLYYCNEHLYPLHTLVKGLCFCYYRLV